MTSHSFDVSDNSQTLLRELADVVRQVANPQIDGFTSRLADALLQAAGTAGTQEAGLYQASAELLKKNRYPFYYVVATRIETMLERELSLTTDMAANDGLPALPPDLEIDKTLCLRKAARALDAEHAERLGILNLRLAALLGRETLDTEQNPFRPELFLTALHEAWLEFQPDAHAHALVYRLLGPQLCLDLGPVLHALNGMLAKRGIGARPAAQLAPAPQPEPEPVRQEAPDNDPLLLQLRRLFPQQEPSAGDQPVQGAFPALFQDGLLQAAHSRQELLDLLSRLRDRLPSLQAEDIRGALSKAELSDSDEATIRLVGRIFDAVGRNLHLPDTLKAPILSLHLPVLKVALEDHDFFFKEAHPARSVVELLVRLALGWDRRMGETDPVYPLFMRSVHRINAESDSHTGVFAEVTEELKAFAKREQTATEQALATPISDALKKEKRLQARRAARHQVELRVGTGEVAAFVETFLEEKWVAVLTLAYVNKDEKPQAVDSALRTMDELVWSVKPKVGAEERQELLSRLPPMIAMLNKWLDMVKWTGDGRTRFFMELARCHASLVRAPVDMSPQRQVELALEASQRAVERREQRRAAQAPEPERDVHDDTVAQLQAGAWLAFRGEGPHPSRLKLAWVSPMRNLYLFATRDRKEAMTMTAEELAQALRGQQAQVAAAAGLVGRVLSDALCANQDGRAAA